MPLVHLALAAHTFSHPHTIVIVSDGVATTKPVIMMTEEVPELMKTCYEDLFINYPSDLMNFPLEFENVGQHQQQQQDIANNNSYQEQVYYNGTTLKTEDYHLSW